MRSFFVAVGLCALLSIGWLQPALAQDAPKVASPLRVEPEQNGVNLTSGKITINGPTLSVPAAPRLIFKGAQNSAPYITGDTKGGTIGGAFTITTSYYSVHTGDSSSESYRCFDYDDCRSLIGTGSMFEAIANQFTQAETGALFNFNLKSVDSQTANSRVVTYYASTISYPDGEVISFTYNTVNSGSGATLRTNYRPSQISSNLGYHITITYQPGTFPSFAWYTPQQATLYQTSNPTVPLAQLTFSGSTITDLAGRQFQCSGCAYAMGSENEVTGGSLTLPTESSPSLQVTSHATLPLVAQVTKDGVAYNYSYTNPRLNGLASNYIYDKVTVSGPLSYVANYNITSKNSGGPGSQRNVLSSISDPLARVTALQFDTAFRPIKMTYPEGNSVDVAYDLYGNVSSRTTKAKAGSGLADLIESAYVDTAGCWGVLCYRPIWVRDAKGNQTDFIYNSYGQLTEQTDPADAAGVRRKTYVTYESVPVGSSSLSRKKVVRICGTGGACGSASEVRTEYDYLGTTFLVSQERKVDAAQGLTLATNYAYDAAGRLLSIDGPLPGSDDAIYYRYDVLGRRTWEIGPKGQTGVRKTTRTTYRDSDDKVTKVEIGTLPDSTSTALTVYEFTDFSYDTRGNRIRSVRNSGATTYAVLDQLYDTRNRLDCSTVRMNLAALPATGTACALGTQGSGVNDFGPDRITKRTYDAASQLTKTQVAVGTAVAADDETNTYTNNGKLATVTDGENNRTTFEYDGHDRLQKTRYPATALGALTSSTTDFEQLTYDANGNVTQRRLRDGQLINNSYDNLNRPTFKDLPAPETDVSYSYDLMNRMTQAVQGAQSNVLGYDALGRMTSETSSGYATNMQYDVAGRLTRVTHSDGVFFNYGYTNADLTAISENGVNTLVNYGYDDLSRRTNLWRANGTATTLSYDPVSRLSDFTQDLAGTAQDLTINAVGYNPESQLITLTRSNDGFAWSGHYNVNRAYGTNGLNQLTSAGATALGYDGRGNLTTSGSNAYAFTAENRLISGPAGVSITYDPTGRIQSLVQSGSTIRFEHLGPRLIIERNGAGTILRRYVHGPRDDEPVIWYEGVGLSDKRWLHTDERGSVIAISNGAGSGIGVNRYDEFGIPLSSNMGRFQYTGQAWLPEIGLYYYKARMYSPTLGRFMQTDPIGYEDGINWYDYAAGDPINSDDPDGTSRRRSGPNAPAPNAARTNQQQLYAAQIFSRASETKAVFPSAMKYFPTYVGAPTAANALQAGAVVRSIQILGPTNLNPQARLGADPAGAAIQNVLRGSQISATPNGTPHFVSASSGATARDSAFAAMTGQQVSANGIGHAKLSLGNGLTASITAYTDSSRGGPAINIGFSQSIIQTGSLVRRNVQVMEAKIRF